MYQKMMKKLNPYTENDVMTKQEIRDKAPVGATHYIELNFIGDFEFFKVYANGVIYVWDEIWYKLIEDQYDFIKSKLKPL